MRLPATLAGATAGALVAGLVAMPAHAESATDGPHRPIGTVARTVGDARFVPGPCPRTADPIPDLARARCGTLTVPENRSGPKGADKPKGADAADEHKAPDEHTAPGTPKGPRAHR
ncbi:hypothetical protein ACFVDH_39260, partial [Streptomyces sp. NPDC057674]